MSFFAKQSAPGEYVMPLEQVEDLLGDIYGRGNTLERLKNQLKAEAAAAKPPLTPDDLDDMERLRQNRDVHPAVGKQDLVIRMSPRFRFRRHIGNMPQFVPASEGILGSKVVPRMIPCTACG